MWNNTDIIGYNDVVGAHLLDVLDFILVVGESVYFGTQGFPEQYGIVTLQTISCSDSIQQTKSLTSPPIPTMPTFLPGPAPLRFSGENTVRPAHNIDAASRDSSLSGIANTNCSLPRMAVE